MSKRRIISLVGIDGSGKSTQAQLLVERLKNEGSDAAWLWNRWEPWAVGVVTRTFHRPHRHASNEAETNRDSGIGRKQRLLKNRAVAWLWLVTASAEYALQSRYRLQTTVADVVVSDRYFPDFVVDQAMNLGGKASDVDRVLGLVPHRWFIPSDVVVVLLADPEQCARRKWDGLPPAALAARQSLYARLVELGYALAVDASLDVDSVSASIDAVLGGTVQSARVERQ